MRKILHSIGSLEANFLLNMLFGIIVGLMSYLLTGNTMNIGTMLAVWYCGIWVIGVLGYYLLIFLGDSKRRQPNESWWAFSKRIQRDNDNHPANSSDTIKIRDSYVELDCGHVIHIYSNSTIPRIGGLYWCFGHRRFGPAEQHTVVDVRQFAGIDYQEVLY